VNPCCHFSEETKIRVPGLVSIVVPIFNSDRFLGEALDSVLAQSYQQWELLLVDDGSTDESPEIAKRYARLSPGRIFYLEHPEHRNSGTCTSRNLGVRRSRGEFVALLDSDDIWLPEKLEQQVEMMQTHPEIGLVCGPSIYFEEGEIGGERIPPLAPPGVYLPPGLIGHLPPVGVTEAPCPSSFLMRRELLDTVGGFEECFDPSSPFEDQAFLAKVYLRTPVLISDKCWTRYRCHSASCCGRAKIDGSECRRRIFYFEWLRNHLRESGIEDAGMSSALRRATWLARHPMTAECARAAKRTLQRFGLIRR
jgi:glycosyltransferase involved in cell wall biosynthesis